MVSTNASAIEDLLIKDLPRELILSVQEGLTVGAQRAYVASRGIDSGHLANFLGQQRHFHMNETFHQALVGSGIRTSDISGNQVIVGRCGKFQLARLNVRGHTRSNYRRSKIRQDMSKINITIESLVQPGLFDDKVEITDAVAFFVAVFSNSPGVPQDVPQSISLVVPNHNMKQWLFNESLEDFLIRYEMPQTHQPDLAVPVLKPDIERRKGQSGDAV